MPAKRTKSQLQKIQRIRRRRLAGRKKTVRDQVRGGGARGAARSTARSAISGKYVVSQHESRSGDVTYRVTRYSSEAGQKPTPRTGIFDFGDPTLARRVEEELYRSDR